MQFQVPQFIETEDKIVGPLSLRQFLYASAGAGLTLLLYFIVVTWLWFFLAIVIMGSTLAVAFVKVNGRPFGKLARAALQYYWQPQTYVWLPDRPDLPKTQENIQSFAGGFSVENLLAGMALKSAWHQVQLGTKQSAEQASRGAARMKEKYEIIQKVTGDRRLAKRVDYR